MNTIPRNDPAFAAHVNELMDGGDYPKRRATGPMDYGDNATARMQLKRLDYEKLVEQPDAGPVFAVYSGTDGHHWYVLPFVGIGYRYAEHVEVFDSEEEMKQRWQLD